jgi:hypothetical protein
MIGEPRRQFHEPAHIRADTLPPCGSGVLRTLENDSLSVMAGLEPTIHVFPA